MVRAPFGTLERVLNFGMAYDQVTVYVPLGNSWELTTFYFSLYAYIGFKRLNFYICSYNFAINHSTMVCNISYETCYTYIQLSFLVFISKTNTLAVFPN